MLTGLLLAAAGQHLVNAEPGVDLTFGLARRFDLAFRLEIRNAGSTLSGLLVLLLGGTLFALAAPVWPRRRSERFDGPLPAQRKTSRWERALFSLSCILWLVLVIALRKGLYTHWFVLGLALLVAGITVPVRRFLRPTQALSTPPFDRRDAILVACILLVGGAALLPALGRHPMTLLGDEGIFFEHAQAFSVKWEGNALGLGTYSYPALGNYYQALVVDWFRGTVWGWRFSSVLASLAALPLFYLLFRQSFSRLAAVLSVLFCIGSPYFLAVSRMGYLSNHTIPIVALFLVVLQAALRRRDLGLLFVAGVASGLGFHSYPPSKVSIVIGVLAISILVVLRRIDLPKALGCGALFVAGNALLVVPHVASVAFQDPVGGLHKLGESLFLNTWSLNTLFPEVSQSSVWTTRLGDQTIFFEPRLAAILVVRGIVRTLLLFHDHEMIGQQFMITGMVGFLAPVLYVLGLCTATLRVFQRPFTLAVLLYFACFFCLSALNTGGDRHSHLLPIVPAAGLFTAIPLILLVRALPARRRRGGRLAASATAAVIAAWGCYTYYVLMPRIYQPTLDTVVAYELTDGPRSTPVWYVRAEAPGDPLEGMNWTRFKLDHLCKLSPFETLTPEALTARLRPPGARATVFARPEMAESLRTSLTVLGDAAPELEPIDVPGLHGTVRLGFRLRLQPAGADRFEDRRPARTSWTPERPAVRLVPDAIG